MAHWPKTVSGNLFTFGLIVVVVPLLVWFVVTLPSVVLLGIAAVALVAVALVIWRRRLEAARERAWVGEFSFGDVVLAGMPPKNSSSRRRSRRRYRVRMRRACRRGDLNPHPL